MMKLFVSVFKSLRKDLGFLGGFLRIFRDFFQIFEDFGFFQTFLGCNSKHSNIRMFESLIFELSSRVESNIRLFRMFAHPYTFDYSSQSSLGSVKLLYITVAYGQKVWIHREEGVTLT